jgi:dolichol kinase
VEQNIDQLKPGNEIKRKVIHLGTALFPLLYFFYLTQEQMVVILVIFTMVFLSAELIRYHWPWAKNLFASIFFPLLREDEKYRYLTGATLFLISTTVIVILFEKTIAVTAVLILSVSDSLAAVVGKTLGRHRFLAKSWEGSTTFFLCSMLMLRIFVPQLSVGEMLLVAGPVTLVEAMSLPVNDNLTIPVAAAVLLKLCI